MLDLDARVKINEVLKSRAKLQSGMIGSIKHHFHTPSVVDQVNANACAQIYDCPSARKSSIPYNTLLKAYQTYRTNNARMVFAAMTDARDILKVVMRLEQAFTDTIANHYKRFGFADDAQRQEYLDTAADCKEGAEMTKAEHDRLDKKLSYIKQRSTDLGMSIGTPVHSGHSVFCENVTPHIVVDMDRAIYNEINREASLRGADAFNRCAALRMNAIDADLGFAYFIETPNPEFAPGFIRTNFATIESNLKDCRHSLGVCDGFLDSLKAMEMLKKAERDARVKRGAAQPGTMRQYH